MPLRMAQRTNAKPLIGFYSPSGGGKTTTALLLARGFVGPNGKIAMIETESGRGEALVDAVIDDQAIGKYRVWSLPEDDKESKREGFSPKAYGKAIAGCEAAKVDALIIDSVSHEWEGVGGVLDMATHNQEAGAKSMQVWLKPKMEHSKHFMLKLTQTAIPLVIICMRAKYPMKEVVNDKGKKEWARMDKPEPKQSDDILFELFFHAWLDDEHKIRDAKYTVPSLAGIIKGGEVVTLETGKRLAIWAAGGKKKLSDRLAECPDLETLATIETEWLNADKDGVLASAANKFNAALAAKRKELTPKPVEQQQEGSDEARNRGFTPAAVVKPDAPAIITADDQLGAVARNVLGLLRTVRNITELDEVWESNRRVASITTAELRYLNAQHGAVLKSLGGRKVA